MLGGGERSPERINAEQWNAALLLRNGSFLQSWEWSLFQQRYGRRATFLAMSEDAFAWDLSMTETHADAGVAWHDADLQAAIFEHRLPLGITYFYVPRGPVLSGSLERPHEDLFTRFHAHVRDLASSRGTAFMRIEPAFPAALKDHALSHLIRMGFQHVEGSIQPRRNLIIDITPSEIVLKRHMHQKTRYNIKVARKHGVEVWWVEGTTGLKDFLRLNEETAKRQNISTHEDAYYEKMFSVIPALPQNNEDLLETTLKHRLYFASFRDKPIASAVVVYFGDRATYLHGSSADQDRNVMAPYLLHWTIMEDAKAMGYKQYDFGGVDDKQWPGITRFKNGFAGWVEEFPGLYELPMNKLKYRIYKAAKRLKR